MTKQLLQRPRLLVAIVVACALVSTVCAAVNSGRLSLLPPHLNHSSGLETATAANHVMVDFPAPSMVYRRTDLNNLVDRAELLGRISTTEPVLALIAKRMGIPAGDLSAIARITADVPSTLTDPVSEQRATEIVKSYAPYRIEIQVRPALPVVDVYTQAPTVDAAIKLGDEWANGLQDYVRTTAARDGIPAAQLLQFKPLGGARGTAANSKAPYIIGLLTFVVVFALCASVALLILRLRLPKPERPPRYELPPGDDWPNTRRVLPWMVAGLIAMIWLVPFNQVKLNWSGPIDLQLDRLVLPVIVATWVFALAAGGPSAPRWRPTHIHTAVAVFVGIAFFSVVLDARYISHVLELDLAIKQLPLLVSYVTVFLIVSTVIRPAEVRPLMKYSLVLATIASIGIIYESRTHSNIFYSITGKVLPGAFEIQSANDGVLDSIGRAEIKGATEVGVEAASVLSMAMPIALVFLMQAKERREKILYALAALIIVAGTFATGRKSALVAPVSVGFALAYFRRRELLKLAPLGLVLIVVVSALLPGVLHGLLGQFTRSDAATVPTTSDRTSDYDALRPDVWSHLAFGRGWGTYNHDSYRILDSEVLLTTVEIGVLGLLAYIAVGMSTVLVARRHINLRDDRWAPLALMGACAAVCFITVSFLFDVLAFPHGSYTFLYMAALVVVVVTRGLEPDEAPVVAARARAPVRGSVVAGRRPRPPAGVGAQAQPVPERWSGEAWDSESD
jgi:hypothetical protein